MRAMAFDAHGGPEVITLREVPTPEPGPGEVRIRVAACGVNHLDIFVRNGIPGVGPFPHILGSEISGTIEKLGSGVLGLVEGDKVVVAPGRGCGSCRQCASGHDNRCPQFQVLGNQRQGGYADFVVVSEDDCLRVSDRLPLADWAAVPLVFQTAWSMLFSLGRLQPGDDVLIESAGSGVGTAAVEIAKQSGARVAASAGGEAKCERLRAMGVDLVIDHTLHDPRKAVLAWTDGKGVEIVISHVGGPMFARSLGSLARGGRLVTCGATAGPKVEVDLRFVFTRELQILGAYLGSRSDLEAVISKVEQGKLHPTIDRRYHLADLGEAHRRMSDRALFGKLLVEPTS